MFEVEEFEFTDSYTEEFTDTQGQENLVFVQRMVALGVAVLLISTMIYLAAILLGGNGLVTYLSLIHI